MPYRKDSAYPELYLRPGRCGGPLPFPGHQLIEPFTDDIAEVAAGYLALKPRDEVEIVERAALVRMVFIGFQPFVQHLELLLQLQSGQVVELAEKANSSRFMSVISFILTMKVNTERIW